jgi:hypothetical protein
MQSVLQVTYHDICNEGVNPKHQSQGQIQDFYKGGD